MAALKQRIQHAKLLQDTLKIKMSQALGRGDVTHERPSWLARRTAGWRVGNQQQVRR